MSESDIHTRQFCPNCQAEIRPGMVRCRECGHIVPRTTAAHPDEPSRQPPADAVADTVVATGERTERAEPTVTPPASRAFNILAHRLSCIRMSRAAVIASMSGVVVAGTVAAWLWFSGPIPATETIWTETPVLTAVAYSSDGHFLLAGGAEGQVLLHDLVKREIRPLRPQLAAAITCLAVTPDDFVIATDTDQHLIGWDLSTHRREQLPLLPSAVTFIAIRPGQLEITFGLQDGTLAVLTPAGLKGRPSRHNKGVKCGCYSQDGRQLVTGGTDGKVIVWDTDRQTVIAEKVAHSAEVSAIVLQPNRKQAVSADWNGEIVVWDSTTWNALRRRIVADGVADLAVQQDYLVVAAWSGALQWRRLDDDRLLRQVQLPAAILSVDVSPNQEFVAAVCGDRAIRLWAVPE